MAQKRLISKYVMPLVALALLVFAASKFFHNDGNQSSATALPAFVSEHKMKVAGTGVVEPQSEIVNIAPNIEGVITKVPVVAGQQVKTGDLLFTIDDRAAKAELQSAVAAAEVARIAKADAQKNFSFYKNLADKRAVSQEEYSKNEYAYKKAAAEYAAASARAGEISTTIDRLNVKSPIDAEVLKVNARAGEYAKAAAAKPLMVIGDTKVMNVRVEIDETDAQRFKISGAAVGSLRNQENKSTELTFVRIEPLLAAKKSLTGDGNERVDTRVLEIIYSFDNAKIHAYPGQQMDVFIGTE